MLDRLCSFMTLSIQMVEIPHTITQDTRFFLEPTPPRQRQYEALRAYFVERLPSAEAARRFGYQEGSFRILCWRFRHEMDRNFFRDVPHGPKTQPRKDAPPRRGTPQPPAADGRRGGRCADVLAS